MNNWEDLKNTVGQWSAANFGSQKGLGCLVPLLGVVEEFGEFYAAEAIDDSEDALGDMAIFLVDYCYRSGVDLSDMPLSGIQRVEHDSLASAVGHLTHCQVKRMQRIRGMEDLDAFHKARYAAVGAVINKLNFVSRTSIFEQACKVWSNVVSKRKWYTVPDGPLLLEHAVEDYILVAGELNRLS